MRTLLTAIAIVLATTAGAQAQAKVTASEKDCKRLVRHVAAADVNYKPGVDVRGNAVKPADLNSGGQVGLPEDFSFPLTVDLSERLGLDSSDILARPVLGEIKVSGGKVTFNGEPLRSDEQHEIAKKCKR